MPYIKSRERREKVNIMNKLMSDEEILRIANEKIAKCGGKMTSSQGIFYLRLVHHSVKNEIPTYKGDGFILLMTQDEMCYEFHLGKSFVNSSLSVFAKAGLIERRRLTPKEKLFILGDNKGFGNCMITKILAENVLDGR